MYNDLLQDLGLTRNEAKIYQMVLENGESPVGKIATECNINRRNVYDSLNRLIEKGLIFEIRQHNENIYQAVDPRKLMEGLKEKENKLENALPNMLKLFETTPHIEDVYIYRGIEGWKNYMRDILRVGQDVYTIGGKGGWADRKFQGFFDSFIQQAQAKNIGFHTLFNFEVKESNHEILKVFESNHKFLPKGFSAPSTIDIFGDYVVILSDPKQFPVDSPGSFTVMVNKHIAESFRIWFKLLWEISSTKKK